MLCVAIAPDGRTALSGSRDKTLKLWELASGTELRTFAGHSGRVTSVAIAPDGRAALSGSEDNTLNLWGLTSRQELRTIVGHSDSVSSVAIAPDSRTALSGSYDETMRLWDVASGKELRIFNGHSGRVTSVAIAPDGRTALSGIEDRTLILWDLDSGKKLRTFTELRTSSELLAVIRHSHIVSSVAIAPDGRTALWGSGHETLKLLDLASGKELSTLVGHSRNVNSVAIAPDGRTALSGSSDKTLRLWDLASGKELRTFTWNSASGFVYSVAIAPDGRTALSGAGTLKLWDLATGNELCTLAGHDGGVMSVAIAPGGRTAVSGGWDKTLKLWDLATGRELRTFTGHSTPVASVAIAPDGRTVLSGSGTLVLWDFTRGVTHRAFEPRVAAAQARLQQAAGDPVALAILGEWYAFRGMDQWAVEFLGRARERGAAIAPLTLARCYWNLDRNAEARREFRIALEQSEEPGERTYLGRCIQAIDTERERKRQQETIAAASAAKAAEVELSRRADRVDSLVQSGRLVEAVAEVDGLSTNPYCSAGQWYNFAAVYSLASAKIEDRKKEYADRAMELLQRTVTAGWNEAQHAEFLAKDADLDPLRDREDFKKLLADLERKAAAGPGKQP